jgi:hypothetical protein
VISTDVGSVAEMVRPGETGFLVAPGDGEAMATYLETLLGDACLRTRLGLAGRQAVQERGSLDAMVSGYTGLIETIHSQKTGLCRRPHDLEDLAGLASTKDAATVDLESSPTGCSPLDSAR